MIFFIFTILILAVAIGSVSFIWKRQKSLPQSTAQPSENPENYRSLFAPDEAELRAWQKEQDAKRQDEKRVELRQDLLKRAENGDFNSLLEAKIFGDSRLYDEVFQVLLDIDADKLTDFVTKNGLKVTADLVELSAKKLSEKPTLDNLLKLIHLSALTNSAEVFLQTTETTEKLCKEKRLNEISLSKLVEILESHYWLLAAEARISGAGYLLKEKLASLREEMSESNHSL